MQLPREITIEEGDWHHMIPIEVVGWWTRKMRPTAGDFWLVVTADERAALACNLTMRWGVPVNVINGYTHIHTSEV